LYINTPKQFNGFPQNTLYFFIFNRLPFHACTNLIQILTHSDSSVIMTSIVARTGRHLQRYDNNLRLVSGCIPYRLDKTQDHNKIEVLMVSSPNRDDMVFPKSDETVEEAACREALEEAGVRGILEGNALGVWEFRSKSKQEACSEEGGCKGYMFALRVTEELESWPEQNNRDRKWVVIEEAFALCRYDWMRNALKEFVKVMEKGGNKREHEMPINVNKEDKPVTKEDEDCQLMSNICHVNGTLSTYGIMVPARFASKSFGDKSAENICTDMKIKSQNEREKLNDAKEVIYKGGFYEGTMITGEYAGMRVQDATNKIRRLLLDLKQAVKYSEPEKKVMSRLGDECVVALTDQWYLCYGEEARECLANMNLYSEQTRLVFENTLTWLKQWACSRSFGLGTRIPWDEEFLVESLSDSTIYMAYYTKDGFVIKAGWPEAENPDLIFREANRYLQKSITNF
ncbi:hypothetical protein M8C21_003772, partial [Ambrosia artemisiifolia]